MELELFQTLGMSEEEYLGGEAELLLASSSLRGVGCVGQGPARLRGQGQRIHRPGRRGTTTLSSAAPADLPG